ncbi:MAG: rod shape-determining protein MreD [Candidatus Omnitrophota bacterium]|jgi:rod shape-determining protein MreD
MKWPARCAYFGVILLCAALQVGPAEGLKLFGVKPDLLILTALMAAVFFRSGWALLYAVTSGLIKDSLVVSSFWVPYSLTFAVWALVARGISRRIVIDKWWLRFLLVFCLVNLDNLTGRIWSLLSGGTVVRLYMFIKVSLLESALTALCAAVFFGWYPVFQKRMEPRVPKSRFWVFGPRFWKRPGNTRYPG